MKNPANGPSSRNRAWAALAVMALIVAAFGGTAREDLAQVTALRPFAALMLAPALYWFAWQGTKGLRFLLVLLALLTLWMAAQLVPLPPDFWQSLPGRGPIAELDTLAGQSDLWRPISMAPLRSWNALASLVVPIAALLLVASVRAKSRILLLLIAVLGLVDATLGLMQLAAPGDALHFYRITNENGPVGLLANENHSATFSAIALLIVAHLASSSRKAGEPDWLRFVYPAAFVLILLAILANGSRAGLVFGLFALIVSMVMFWPSGSGKKPIAAKPSRKSRFVFLKNNAAQIAFGAGIVVLVALILAFVFSDDVPALKQLLNAEPLEDLRADLFPTIRNMLMMFWLFGIGFGAFKDGYHQFEATELLMPRYVNQAHNDWMQIVIEGGLPAALILGALLLWLAWNLAKLASREGLFSSAFLMWASAFAIVSAASVVDYPLRTPIFQFVSIWLLASLAIKNYQLSLSGAQQGPKGRFKSDA